MRNYNLTLKIGELNKEAQEISIIGSFEEEEWELLELYSQYVEDLTETKLVQDGMPTSLNIGIEPEHGVNVKVKLPVWDDVIIFLHKFRPIGLESESTFYYKIASIVSRRVADPHFRALIKQYNDIYSGKQLQSRLKLSFNDILLNSEKLLYDWLNAYEYHRDKERRQFIESLQEIFPLDASRAICLILLGEKFKAIIRLGRLIHVILGKQTEVKVQV